MDTMRAPSPNKRPREDDGGAPSTMFGDIGGGGEASIDTRDDVPVSSFTPLQRVVLSANGNLQRIVSSYYNAPVVVEVVRNDRVEEGMFNRLVCLKLHDIVFGVAHSTVVITDEAALEAVERDGVAVGQLFRHLNMMPSFSLHAADFSEAAHAVAPMAKLLREFQEDAAAQLGAAFQEDAAAQLGAVALGPGSRRESRAEAATHLGEKPTFWREYTLKGRGVVCSIRETLLLDMFDLAADAASATAFADDAAPTFGDIMSPTMTGLQLPDGFSPLERLLLTANGNIERIVSSYYAQPVTAYVMENHKRQDAVYDRKVAMLVSGQQFMLAKSTVYLTDRSWVDTVERDNVPIGQLLWHMGVLPAFKLHFAGRGLGFFWRVYQLSSPGMVCEIHETFSEDVFVKSPAGANAAASEEQSMFF